MKQIRKILWIMSVVTLLLAMPTTVSAVTKEKFVGTTYRINVKGNFKWTSSNKKIAVVNQRNKTVKALRAGTVIITGKNGTQEKKFKLKVKKPYINADNMTIYAGKKGKLKLKGTSPVKWKTSNSKILSDPVPLVCLLLIYTKSLTFIIIKDPESVQKSLMGK